MPLQSGKENIGKNISELSTSKPSASRAKGIATLAHRRGISLKRAKNLQAIAISEEYARRNK